MEALKQLKDEHSAAINKISKEITEHIAKYGPTPCGYLMNSLSSRSYHTGAWNALNQLESEL